MACCWAGLQISFAELVCEFNPLKLDPDPAEWHNIYIKVHLVYLEDQKNNIFSFGVAEKKHQKMFLIVISYTLLYNLTLSH